MALRIGAIYPAVERTDVQTETAKYIVYKKLKTGGILKSRPFCI